MLDTLVSKWVLISPDIVTAQVYGQLRAKHDRKSRTIPTTARVNDLWIAALCIQYDLVLLTHDSGFRSIPSLKCESW